MATLIESDSESLSMINNIPGTCFLDLKPILYCTVQPVVLSVNFSPGGLSSEPEQC